MDFQHTEKLAVALVRPSFLPLLTEPHPESGTLILRDGTTALLRPAQPDDVDALEQFLTALSPDARQHRFFSQGMPSRDLIETWCDSSNPQQGLTLLVIRLHEGQPRLLATGTYAAREPQTAEVAFAVDDAFHGKGLGTLLFEHLALLAIRHGYTRLWAVTHPDNRAMREVFKESGYTLQESVEGAEIEVALSLLPTEATVTRHEIRDRLATIASLRPFFHPRSVAVIGASRDPKSIGYRLVEALVSNGFAGPVFPVNPLAQTIYGLPAFADVQAIPDAVDLAVIAVPCTAVLDVAEACAKKNVRALVVISAGFAETGPNGQLLQQQLLDLVRQHGLRMVGPNCFGVVNADPAVRLNATFTNHMPPSGHVAMSSQSGALGIAMLTSARHWQLGLSTFVSVGNKADVSVNDLLQYWEADPNTNVVLLYVESFGNPRRFARLARRVSQHKPIVVMKAGRTTAGGRAAGSHTAALMTRDAIVDALFHQTGVLRAETLEQFFALATGLSSQPLPAGRRVGILSNTGGPAILCADACELGGLTVPELSESTRQALKSILPAHAALNNPVDLIASATAEHYRQTIEVLVPAPELDALIVLYLAVHADDAEAIARGILGGLAATRQAGIRRKPVYLCWMVEGDPDRSFVVEGETFPAYALPEIPAQVFSKVAAYAEWRAQPPGHLLEFEDAHIPDARAICHKALATHRDAWLGVNDTHAVLAAAGLPLAPGGFAATADTAVALARRLGFPVAVKLASRHLVHKTEVGGVHLHLTTEAQVRLAFEAIHSRLNSLQQVHLMDGVTVQPMISGGVEVMAGMSHDPLFGPVLAFGLGGVYVEILRDTTLRITPLTDRDAHEMVRTIRGFPLLEGYRGHPPADIPALEELLLRLSQLVDQCPEIAELDLNPIIALPPGQGCRIVDARIRVQAPSGS